MTRPESLFGDCRSRQGTPPATLCANKARQAGLIRRVVEGDRRTEDGVRHGPALWEDRGCDARSGTRGQPHRSRGAAPRRLRAATMTRRIP